MGILSKVTKVVSNIGGGHAIDRNKVLGATGHGVVNPSTPGNWSTVRTWISAGSAARLPRGLCARATK